MEIIIAIAVVLGVVSWFYNRKPAVTKTITEEVKVETKPVAVEEPTPAPVVEKTPAPLKKAKPAVQKATTKPTAKKAPPKKATAKKTATNAKKTVTK